MSKINGVFLGWGRGFVLCISFACNIQWSIFFLLFELAVEGKSQLQKRLVLKSNILLFQSVLAFVKAVK